jgi:enoyl-CoA hydratase
MPVRIETSGAVWTIVHDRPEARNAVDEAHAQALYEAFVAFEADPSAAVAVFAGRPEAFCAGWDLKAAAQLTESGGADLAHLDFAPDAFGTPGPRGPMGPSRLRLSKPVIAAIEGPAVAGGMELALWCDVRIMADTAYMGVYCRRWGVPLIDGGTVRLPRLVGMGRAMDIILTGRKVDAEECLRIGLCERVVPTGTARAAAEAYAQELTRFPQACLRSDRLAAYEGWDADIPEALHREWSRSKGMVAAEGVAGAARFAAGKGRGGHFGDI